MENNWIELFDRYLRGELKDDELINFNNEMLTNTEFAKKFELYKDVNNTLKNKKLLEFKEILNEAYEEYLVEEKSKKRINMRFVYIAAAASVAILISIGYFWFYKSSNTNQFEQKLLSSNLDEVSLLAGGVETTSPKFNEAQQAYIKGNYKLSIQLYEELLLQDSLNAEAKVSLGISYLDAGQYENCRQIMTSFINDPNSVFVDVAQWNMALSFYREKNYPKAKEWFGIIVGTDNHYKKADAQKALELINEKENK